MSPHSHRSSWLIAFLITLGPWVGACDSDTSSSTDDAAATLDSVGSDAPVGTDTSNPPDTSALPDTSVQPDTGEPSNTPHFREDAGYVVMEMESVAIEDKAWAEETDLEGGSGSYYRYLGNGICNGPANDPLVYSFRVDTSGVWELRLFMARIWHCVEGARHDADNHVCLESESRGCKHLGEPNGEVCGSANSQDLCLRKDLSNDVFVRIEDASGNFVAYTERTSNEDQTKLFGGGQNAFAWSGTNALDPGGPKKPAQWDLPAGDYTLTVFGRSQGTRVDRMLLFHTESANFNDGKSVTETLY